MEQMMETRSGALAVLAQQGALLKRNLRGSVPIEARRIALERMITLEFPHCGAFFAEYSANISMTGLFIRTDRFQPPGTRAAFELSIADGDGLIRGEAEVVWVRERHEGSDRPAGLGLRFIRLDEDGRQQIRRAVEKRQREGRASLEERSSVTSIRNNGEGQGEPTASRDDTSERRSEGKIDAPGLPPYVGAEAAQTADRRWRWVVFGASAAALVATWVFIYQGTVRAEGPGVKEASGASELKVEGAEDANPVQPVALPRPVGVPGAAARIPDVPTSADSSVVVEARLASPEIESSPQSGTEPSRQEIADVVVAWAESWSMQEVDAYLSFYAESYRPADGMSRAQWSAQRQDRISRPRQIRVEVADLEVRIESSDQAQVRFQQIYTSDRYQDQTRKILDLVLEQGAWKIQREQVEG